MMKTRLTSRSRMPSRISRGLSRNGRRSGLLSGIAWRAGAESARGRNFGRGSKFRTVLITVRGKRGDQETNNEHPCGSRPPFFRLVLPFLEFVDLALEL